MARPLVLIGDELFLDGERVGTLCLPGGSTRDLLEAVLREIDLDVSARQRDDVFYAGYDTGYAAAQEKKETLGWDEGFDRGYDAGFDRGYVAGYDVCFKKALKVLNPDEHQRLLLRPSPFPTEEI